MDLKVERKYLNNVTEKTAWQIIISFITTLERNIPLTNFNKQFVRWARKYLVL